MITILAIAVPLHYNITIGIIWLIPAIITDLAIADRIRNKGKHNG